MGNIWRALYLYTRLAFDLAVDFFFSLYWDRRKKPIPDLDKKHAILTESAVTLAKKIRQKELKSEDLVRAVIERIKEVSLRRFIMMTDFSIPVSIKWNIFFTPRLYYLYIYFWLISSGFQDFKFF